jgi:hypothetical protein
VDHATSIDRSAHKSRETR